MDASSVPAGRAESETRGSSQGGVVDASSAPAGRAESETRGSSQEGAVDASLAPAGRAESETRGLSQGGAVHTSAPAGRVESETRGSSQGGALDASSVPIGRAESDLRAASTSDTDQGNCEDPPAVVLDGIRSPFPVVVLMFFHVQIKQSRKSGNTLCFLGVGRTRRGLVGLKYIFNGWRSKDTLVRFGLYS